MARIAGVDIPRDKRVDISLRYIFGIGRDDARRSIVDAGAGRTRRRRCAT